MADSWQLAILKAMTLHLQGIIPPDYDFDLSTSVFRGRLIYGDDDPTPLVSIVEHLSADVTVDVAGHNRIDRSETWVLLVQGWLTHTPNNPTDDAYNLKAAVEKRLSMCIEMDPATGDPKFPSVYMLGFHKKCITNMTIGPGVVSVAVRAEASNKAFFYLPVGIGLATKINEPFAP